MHWGPIKNKIFFLKIFLQHTNILLTKFMAFILHLIMHDNIVCSRDHGFKNTFKKLLLLLLFFYFTILYWFCHTSTCIHHGCTRVPHPEIPSHLPPHTIPLGHPSAPAPSFLYPALNLDWRFISYMILYMF